MNRLILIGNGFDLAHGLKTSYHDFILDYLKGCCIQSINNIHYQFNPNYNTVRNLIETRQNIYTDKLINISIGGFQDIVLKNNLGEDPKREIIAIISKNDTIKDILSTLKTYEINIIYMGITEYLLNELITKNWVDIESIYYQELKKIIPQFQQYKSGKTNDYLVINRIKNLNDQLDFIKTNLEKYLKKILTEEKNLKIEEFKDIFHLQKFYGQEERKILVLNFNYTLTPKQYLNDDEIIFIHGELCNNNNQLIFGYGDEVDKNYKEIEDLNENEFFKHIKSFDYFKTTNYTTLLKFIDSNEFEIFSMGHSLGLSDRTMLSTIFEHENCKSIKIFYNPNDDEDFRNKTYEISRHFNNKASMRKKIVPFPDCIPMPQYNDK